MTSKDSVVPDLTSDNFDLLRFPSLTGFSHDLPADNDDLNIIARLGSLFDSTAKPTIPAISPLSSTGDTMPQSQHASQQTQSQVLPQPASLQRLHTPPRAQPMPFSANSPGYPMLLPGTSAPSAVQMMAARPPTMMQSPFALPAQTSFESERSQHNFQSFSAQDGAESEFSDDDLSDPEQAVTPRRSARKRNATQVSRDEDQNWMKPKKKVGRPITYNGDPNAPELTEAERRKVKRRIANRESARRVQQRRKEMIDELQHKLIYIQHHHHHLMQHLSKLELEKGQLFAQLTELKHKFTDCSTENVRLSAQVKSLQQQFDQRQQLGGVTGGQAVGLAGALPTKLT